MTKHQTDMARARLFAVKFALRDSRGEIANLSRAFLHLQGALKPSDSRDEGSEEVLRPSIASMLQELKETWELDSDELEHIAELANNVYNAGYKAGVDWGERNADPDWERDLLG